jgi:hypothetical protein
MLRKIHGTNLLHTKFLRRININCQNGPVLPSAQVFYFNGQALNYYVCLHAVIPLLFFVLFFSCCDHYLLTFRSTVEPLSKCNQLRMNSVAGNHQERKNTYQINLI